MFDQSTAIIITTLLAEIAHLTSDNLLYWADLLTFLSNPGNLSAHDHHIALSKWEHIEVPTAGG